MTRFPDDTAGVDPLAGDTTSGETVRVVTLSIAKGLQPCQYSRGVSALSMTHSH